MHEKRVEALQCLDYYLSQEIASSQVEKTGYAARISKKIAALGHVVSQQNVYTRKRQILVEGRVLQPASVFSGKPMPRLGKDKNYHHVWSLVDMFIPCRFARRYIGLPANQLDVVASKIEQDPCLREPAVVACELNSSTRNEMTGIIDNIIYQRDEHPSVRLEGDDVFQVMKREAKSQYGFNVFDLDLMIALPDRKKLQEIADLTYDCANKQTHVVFHLSALTARTTDNATHKFRVEILCDALERAGFDIVGHPTHFEYTDSKIPMGCLRVVLRKKPRRTR